MAHPSIVCCMFDATGGQIHQGDRGSDFYILSVYHKYGEFLTIYASHKSDFDGTYFDGKEHKLPTWITYG